MSSDFYFLLLRLFLLLLILMRALLIVTQQSERDLKRCSHHVLVWGNVADERNGQLWNPFTAEFGLAKLHKKLFKLECGKGVAKTLLVCLSRRLDKYLVILNKEWKSYEFSSF